MPMSNPRLFFNEVKTPKLLGPVLDNSEVSGCNAIIDALDGLPISHVSYGLGTAYLETAHTMQPVKEANWLSDAAANRYFFRMYDINGSRPAVAKRLGNLQPGDGIKFPGMGYPQMTGRVNYTKAAQKLGVDLINHPELAMQAEIAAKIMRYGMVEGWFTGKKFSDYLPFAGNATRAQFVQARRIINGTDRAGDVADATILFQQALQAGGYK